MTLSTLTKRLKLLVKVKQKHTTDGNGKKVFKIGLVVSISMHLQVAPIYVVKYRIWESKNKLLRKLINKDNLQRGGRSVKMKHCFRGEETHETARRRKILRWLLCSFKEIRRNYMKGKICLTQQLLKDSFAAKRYGKGLLIPIKEEKVC